MINTEIDINDYALTTTNYEGTVTTSVVFQDGSTEYTRYIAYPTTGYVDYPSTYSLCGTVHTTISGYTTCLTYQSGCDVTEYVITYAGPVITSRYTAINNKAPTFTYPSHPPLPKAVDPNLDLVRDPKGWGYAARTDDYRHDSSPASLLFPDLGLWACTEANNRAGQVAQFGGPRALETALVITATSTLMETEFPSLSKVENLGPIPAVAATTSAEPPRLVSPPSPPVTVFPASTRLPKLDSGDEKEATLVSKQRLDSPTVGEVIIPGATLEPAVAGYAHANGPDPPHPVMAEPISLVLAPTTLFDRRGNAIATTNLAAIIPVTLSSTNAKGEIIGSTSLSTAIVTASTPMILSSTNAQSSIISSTSYVPIMVLATTDSLGSQLVTTLPLLPAHVPFPTKAQDSQAPGITPPPLPANARPILTIGSQIVTANSEDNYVIDGQTLTPGGRITISGITVSLSPNGMEAVVGTSIQKLTSRLHQLVTSPPALTINGETITANSATEFIIDGQTLTPGGIVIVSGITISLSPDGMEAVVGASTQRLSFLPTITPAPTLTINGQIVTANSQMQYIIDGQTLTPGGTITISGTRISLAPDGTALIIGTSTQNLLTTPQPALTINGQTITPNPLGQYIIDSQTLTPGSIITVSGTRISLASNNAYAVIGTSTEALYSTPRAAIIVGSQTIIANAFGQYMFGTQTLTPGGVVTVDGTRVSLASEGTQAVVGTSTEGLGPYMFGTQTLTPGGIVTVDGTRISLAAGGTQAVVGTSTEGLGSYIIGGLGGGNEKGNESAIVAFTGAATPDFDGKWRLEIVAMILALAALIWL